MEDYKKDMEPVFPNDKIKCKTCVNRKGGVIGYKNSYCDAYAPPPESGGKPYSILFNNADCQFYIEDKFME